ncbi:unnamed protein product [Gordionus sp. m RMFG-2023]|uniref:protein hu-li tai shao-like n=1 Tax=Gordionus sp. m RMFG-2023 TaxID=3053472 RepID=UPI0030E5336A
MATPRAPRFIDTINTEDPEYVKNMQRPADVKEDMRDMDARKRVSAVLNSRAFKQDLEQIIMEQLRDGLDYPSSLIALHHLSDILTSYNRSPGPDKLSLASSPLSSMNARILPVNDIRGADWSHVPLGEKVLRCKLASLYRLVDVMNWGQSIYNHISVRISPDNEHFLINPFGLLYSEITASSLVKVNMQCEILDPGSTTLGISKAGFLIHGAVHGTRTDLRCAIHIHTPSVVAVSCQSRGLLPLSQEALLCLPLVGYHEYQGIALTEQEKEDLIRDLGPRNKILILKNHGLLACGSTIEEAFHYAYHIMLACETQVKALSVGMENLSLINDSMAKATFETANKPDLGVDSKNVAKEDRNVNEDQGAGGYKWGLGEILFESYMRYLDTAGYKTGYPYKHANVWRERGKKNYNDIEIPPSAWSSSSDYWDEKLFKISDFKKKLEKTHWLNSPNAYTKVEVTEIGTNQPKKITKWVPCENGAHHSTTIKEEKDQFAPTGTNKKEFKKLHQDIKDNRRSDKLDGGPQSNILEGRSWEEVNKMQDGKLSGLGDQVIIMGAASKGIIERNHQHNRQAFQQEYQKNPFDHLDYSHLQEYERQLSAHSTPHSAEIYNGNGVNGFESGNGPGHDGSYYYTNGDRDVIDMSTTFRSTDGSTDVTLEEKLNDSTNLSNENQPSLIPTPSSPSKAEGKKKSGSTGFRTPSFLKRKKSKERRRQDTAV